MEEKKKCPYCGEEILAVAKKCKHCGEWLDNNSKSPTIDSKENLRLGEESENKANNFFTIFKILISIAMLAFLFFAMSQKYNLFSSSEKSSSTVTKTNNTTQTAAIIAEEAENILKKESKENNYITVLTCKEWYCKDELIHDYVVDQWLVLSKIYVDNKKKYTTENSFTEEGTLTIKMTFSIDTERWVAESVIKVQEEGKYFDFTPNSIKENVTDCSNIILSAGITYNNTRYSEESLINIARKELGKFTSSSDNTSFFKIKNINNNSLILETNDGTIVNYKR